MKLEILILALALGIARAMPVEKEKGSDMATREIILNLLEEVRELKGTKKKGEPCVPEPGPGPRQPTDLSERCMQGLDLICWEKKCIGLDEMKIMATG